MKSRFFTILCSLSLVLILTSIHAEAADSIFMQVQDIEGTATEKSHLKWHPITSVNWSVERAVDMADLGSTQRGYANALFSKIEVTRMYDYTTPKFFLSVANGTVRPDITLHYTRTAGGISEGMQTYMIIILKDVIIDSLSHSVSEDGIPEETMTLAYTAIEITSMKVDPKTGSLGVGHTAKWNIATGTSE